MDLDGVPLICGEGHDSRVGGGGMGRVVVDENAVICREEKGGEGGRRGEKGREGEGGGGRGVREKRREKKI